VIKVHFPDGRPAFVLVDFDRCAAEVRERLALAQELGPILTEGERYRDRNDSRILR
jgi:hypothetical protein